MMQPFVFVKANLYHPDMHPSGANLALLLLGGFRSLAIVERALKRVDCTKFLLS